VNAHARAEQPSARQRDVHHRNNEKKRNLRHPDFFVNDEADRGRGGEREKEGEVER
jgi:hypothetical protein